MTDAHTVLALHTCTRDNRELRQSQLYSSVTLTCLTCGACQRLAHSARGSCWRTARVVSALRRPITVVARSEMQQARSRVARTMLSGRANDENDDEADPQCAERSEADEFLYVTDGRREEKYAARNHSSHLFGPHLSARHAWTQMSAHKRAHRNHNLAKRRNRPRCQVGRAIPPTALEPADRAEC